MLFFYNSKAGFLSDTIDTAIPSAEINDQEINSITVNPIPSEVRDVNYISNGDYIVECELAPIVEEDSYFEAQQQYLRALSLSGSQDRLLAFALFAPLVKEESRLDLLLKYNEKFPNNSLVLMEAVSSCTNISNSKCSESFIDEALVSDKENGAMWLLSILFFASQGNDEQVINSIDGLVKTSFYNEKYGERVELYVQALAGSNTTNYHTNVISGLGTEAAREIGYSHILDWCKEGVDQSIRADACLRLGRNLEKRGKTSISQLIGVALQRFVHKAENNKESYQALESEKLSNPMMSKSFFKASSLLYHNEKLLRNWLNNIDSIGEAESAKLLIEEAISLSQKKGNSLCTN